jgi:hypothetical protein
MTGCHPRILPRDAYPEGLVPYLAEKGYSLETEVEEPRRRRRLYAVFVTQSQAGTRIARGVFQLQIYRRAHEA